MAEFLLLINKSLHLPARRARFVASPTLDISQALASFSHEVEGASPLVVTRWGAFAISAWGLARHPEPTVPPVRGASEAIALGEGGAGRH
ncbi:unnamed protein product [Dovyalis caffra]|uniref:Uncharacterized protein n=1 Tax=Dovyalis caffra TaxID=77055 RepID=A0AAV1QQ02_9ROSI|nr:unnamed protein product [Dovyalis caffra]